MLNIILVFTTAFLICIFAIPSIITVAKLIGLYDKPNHRKLHTHKIPRLGGMAIFFSFALAALIWGKFTETIGMQYISAALIILFFSGLKDDVVMLSPYKKLLAQIIAAGMVATLTSLKITHFHNIFGIQELSLFSSIIVTIFTIIVVTNSFNLIDGVDGLAGSVSLIISTTYAIWFALVGEENWSILAFALSGAILGFLFFNFSPARIFMGDSGSLTVGFLLALFTIHFLEISAHFQEAALALNSAPGIAVAILIVPLYDTLRVFILRVYNKQSPFKADKNHLHHWLLRMGLSHKSVALILALINLLFIGLAFAIKENTALVVLSIVTGLALAAGQMPAYFLRHKIADIEADSNALNELEEALNPKEAFKE
jgi:UDP-N-acetylmuramyl pentapeptide phosphotransferase/UDP-N-acetylglucosamine-1-phosphate transferase